MHIVIQCKEIKEDKLKHILSEIIKCLNAKGEKLKVIHTSKPVEVAEGVIKGDFGYMFIEREFLLEDARVFVGKVYKQKMVTDSIFIIETKIDDASGEVIANAVERVMEKAIDVEVVSVLGKKGRPSILLRVLSKPDGVGEVAEIVMKETGSIGVRVYRVFRIKSPRKIVKVKVRAKREYEVRVKVSGVNVKPEFEDVKAIAEGEGVTLLEAYRIVHKYISKLDNV